MQSSTYSASNTSYHLCYFYCACYVFRKQFDYFFCKTKQLHHALLLSFSRTIIRKSGSSLRISANIFQIWSKEAGYEEIAVGFRPMRNGKIFKRIISSYWMRSSMIWRILQIKVCYAPYRHGFSNSFESQLKPLVFVTFSFFQYVLNFKTCLPRSM